VLVDWDGIVVCTREKLNALRFRFALQPVTPGLV
jgi:hypothetical protein